MKTLIKNFRNVLLTASGIALLAAGLAFADEDAAWSHYAAAAGSYTRGESVDNIIYECNAAKKETADPVLFARISFLQADALTSDNKFEDARGILRDVQSTKMELPKSLREEAELREGILFLRENKTAEAMQIFRFLHEGSEREYIRREATLALSWQAANEEKWDACRNLLEELQSANPLYENESRVQFIKARLALAEHNSGEAIRLLKDSKDPAGLSLLARAYEMADNRILAVSIYKKLNDQFPGTPVAEEAMLHASEVFMRASDWLAAQSELNRFMQYFPNSRYTDAVHFRLGWAYLNIGQPENALAEFNIATDAANKSYFQYMQAECYRQMGRQNPEKYQDAIRIFRNIASLNMNSPIAPLAKVKAAMTEFEKGDTASALISLKQFLSIYPRNDMAPAINFMVAIHENEAAGKKYFDEVLNSTVTGDIQDAAFFALQNEDYQKGKYQDVINRYSYLKNNKDAGELNFWQRANHLLIAESAYFLKHYGEAVENYRLAQSQTPDDLTEKASVGLAWCRFYTNSVDTAAIMFRQLKKNLDPANRPLAEYGYATALFHLGDYQNALKEFPVNLDYHARPEYTRIVEKSLDHTAECYYRLESYGQAIQYWEKLADEFPASKLAPAALYHAADIYFRANYFAEADSMYSKIIRDYAGSDFAMESQLGLAQSAYNAGSYETAIQRYQKFIDNYPTHEKSKTALEGIQYCYYQLGQSEQAAETLQKVIEQSANTDLAVDARYRMATNYLTEEKFEDAVREFKEILTLYPNSSYAPDAQFSLAKSFLAQNKYQDAAREFNQFIRYFPESGQLAEARFLLGICYFSTESYLSAIDCFNNVIENNTDSEFYASSVQNAGWCYDKLKDKEKALDYFKKYLAENLQGQDRQKVTLQVAKIYADQNQPADARGLFSELAKSSDPAVASEAAYHLGMLYLNENQTKEAKAVFTKASNIGEPSDYYRLSSIAQLAAIYENSGEAQKALNTYELLANSATEEQWINAARERIQALSVSLSGGAHK